MISASSQLHDIDAYLLPRARGVAPYYLRASTPRELEREEKLRRVLRTDPPAIAPLPGCTLEQSDIHARALRRVEALMASDPARESDEGRELGVLVAVVGFYERGGLPGAEQKS